MAGKILTVIPLLVLSGLFFAAGIVEGGVLFIVFATVVLIAFLRTGRGGPWPSPEEAPDIKARQGPGPGAGGAGPG
jgi:hypothetical protein